MGDQEHGVPHYRRGCRCGKCRAAAAAEQRAYRKRYKAALVIDDRGRPYAAQAGIHGATTYNRHGCRCDTCRAGKATYMAAFRQRQKGDD